MKPQQQVEMKALRDLGSPKAPRSSMDVASIMPTLKETMEQLGNAAQAKILGEMLGGMFGHGRGSNEGSSSPIKEVTNALKDLHEISAGREEAYRKQVADLEGKSAKADLLSVEMEKVGIQRDKSMADVMLAMMERTERQKDSGTSEITMLLFKHMLDQQQELMRELRETRKPDKKEDEEEGLLKRLGLDYLQGALNRNPREEYEREHQYWEKRLGSSNDKIHDVELFKVRKELELEEKKWEREVGQKADEEKNRGELYKAMFGALAAIRSGQPLTSAPVAQPGPQAADSGAAVQDAVGSYQVDCPACSNPFFVEKPVPFLTCPHCQTVLHSSNEEEPTPQEHSDSTPQQHNNSMPKKQKKPHELVM